MTRPQKTLGILLLTQSRQGESLLEAAQYFLGDTLPHAVSISLVGNESRGEIQSRLQKTTASLVKKTGGVIILCDLFGSTHANIAYDLSGSSENIACVCGLNLAMLMEACALGARPLKEVTACVANAGRQSIMESSGND